MTMPAIAPEMTSALPNRAESAAEEGAGALEAGFAALLAQAAAEDASAGEGGDADAEATEELLALLAPVEEEAELSADADVSAQTAIGALPAPVAAANVAPAERAPTEAATTSEDIPADEVLRALRAAVPRDAEEGTSAEDVAARTPESDDAVLDAAPADEDTEAATAPRETAEASTRPVAEVPVRSSEAPVGTRTVAEARDAAPPAPVPDANADARGDSGTPRDAERDANTSPGLADAAPRDEAGRGGGAFELPAELSFTPPTRSPELAPVQPIAPLAVAPGVAPVGAGLTPTELPTAPPSGAPADVLPVHVEWLTARGGGSARLQLHPPNLGEVEVNVNVRGNAVDVVIRALEPAAQVAVAQTRELLADGLASQDLRMDQFEVRGAGDEAGSRGAGQERERAALAQDFGGTGDAEGGGRGEPDRAAAEPESTESAEAAPTLPPTPRGASGVDVHV